MDYDFKKEPRGVYFLIDNKSFYASVEASMRGRNPLNICLVVMSEQENTNGGLILATSPEAKRRFHLKANVSRQRDLPINDDILVVPPRMNLYIERNLEINNIFRRFVADEDLLPYSIDESILDLTHSWRLFGNSPREVAEKIMDIVHEELGLYLTIGIGDNPVQSKLALDNFAKKDPSRIGEIHYQTVPETIWKIPEITDVWGIGSRTAKHLSRIHIHNMDELAHTDPFILTAEMGLMGAQLFATAWGVDRSNLRKQHKPKEASLGNSQVLPRDYRNQVEIETVIKEIGEQVASRLRHHHRKAGVISLGIGFSYASSQDTGRSGFHKSKTVEPTDSDKEIVEYLISMFKELWQHETIRNIAVYTGQLSANTGQQLDIFKDPEEQIKEQKSEYILDDIRKRFGFTSLIYARSLTAGGTAINRANLVGGHNGGNAYE
ncbi:Y-family DNA polymerase [Pediococcus argentinicus]|uniref:Y-family DNA polymerase n=1 Tax=Pediococcus argentinicus TaxID=480391 RepID=UPI00338DC553